MLGVSKVHVKSDQSFWYHYVSGSTRAWSFRKSIIETVTALLLGGFQKKIGVITEGHLPKLLLSMLEDIKDCEYGSLARSLLALESRAEFSALCRPG
jgi:hypothetical protein